MTIPRVCLTHRVDITWKWSLLLLGYLCVCQPALGQESKLAGLLSRSPSTPKALAYVHVPSLNSLMSSQNMRLQFADKEEEAWLVSQLDTQQLRPVWEAGYVTLRREIGIDALAFGVSGYVDEVAGKQVVWSPDQSYLLPVSNKSLGILRPANRSLLAKWINPGQVSEIPAYLQSQAKQPEQFLSLMLAIDMKDQFSPISLAKKLESLESTKQANLSTLSKTLSSVQGMSIIVGRRSLSECILSIEFATTPNELLPVANQLINEVLNNNGTSAPEVLTWNSSVNGNTLTLRGPISEDSLHGLVGIFSIANQGEYVVERAEARQKLSEPSAGVAAPSPSWPGAAESKHYFDRVSAIIDRVRNYKAQTTGFRAKWNQQNARRIDEIPILGVDAKLVEFAADVSNLLRGNAREIRGINVEAGQNIAQNRQGFFGDGFGFAGVNNQPMIESGIRVSAAGSGFLSHQDAMIEIEKVTAEVRREMTLKYNIQF